MATNSELFMTAIINSPFFRQKIAGGEADEIKKALKYIGVNLPNDAPPNDFLDKLVTAILGQTAAPGGWDFLNDMRKALAEIPNGGVN